jgi:hypothetical protein
MNNYIILKKQKYAIIKGLTILFSIVFYLFISQFLFADAGVSITALWGTLLILVLFMFFFVRKFHWELRSINVREFEIFLRFGPVKLKRTIYLKARVAKVTVEQDSDRYFSVNIVLTGGNKIYIDRFQTRNYSNAVRIHVSELLGLHMN